MGTRWTTGWRWGALYVCCALVGIVLGMCVPRAFAEPDGLHPSLVMPRALHVFLKLRDDTLESDRETVEALRGLEWFTHVILAVPSVQGAPDAARHPLVLRARNICRANDIDLIWSRWLWVAWPDPQAAVPTTTSHFNPAYYAGAIATVRSEAKQLGAVACGLDAEPYGNSPQKVLKNKLLSDWEISRMRYAVASAVSNTGGVDIVFPTSSNNPARYIWPLTELGRLRFDEKTYYTKGPDYAWPKIRPPTWTEHRVDFFGCDVGLGEPGDVPGLVRLTSREVMDLDWDTIRARYPSCRGVWVYIGYDILPAVVATWGK